MVLAKRKYAEEKVHPGKGWKKKEGYLRSRKILGELTTQRGRSRKKSGNGLRGKKAAWGCCHCLGVKKKRKKKKWHTT